MISVVIPTHNRADILRECLKKLLIQEGTDFEVVVVDDGSTDGTDAVMSEFVASDSTKAFFGSKQKVQIKYIKQPPSHQGVARNRGVKEASGDIIVFIGDDIFVQPGFLAMHQEIHTRHPEENVVVLGYTTWDPALVITDYMKFLESSGWQFGYSFIQPGFIERNDRYKFFYTSNLSIKKSYFNQERFDENFKVYGWEDIELGYRLYKNRQLKLFYEPKAMAYHHHLLDEGDLEIRMEKVGESARVFQTLHPEAGVVPSGLKKWILMFATSQVCMAVAWVLSQNLLYKLRSWKSFLVGSDTVG